MFVKKNHLVNKKHYFFLASILVLLCLFVFALDMLFWAKAEGKVQSYSTGDAIVYNNQIIVGSINAGKIELFKQAEDQLLKKTIVSVKNSRWKAFYDFAFNEEEGRLFVYAVNGRYLYKYDVSNIDQPVIVDRIKDNSWDWFMAIEKTNDHIATIGTRGVKLWNSNLQIVNSYLNPDKNNKIVLSKSGELLFDIKTDYQLDQENDFVRITNMNTRGIIAEPQIVFNSNIDRGIYFDDKASFAYLVGDRVVKQVNIKNGSIKNFKHISTEGFTADGIPGKDHFYFSDGIGLVKMNHNMEPISWQYAHKIGVPGAWSMGMKVLEQNGREKLVVFNHESIVILDSDFKLLASYISQEQVDTSTEELSLSLNENMAFEGSQVFLTGTGFSANSDLKIAFIKDGYDFHRLTIKSDSNGSLQTPLTVPHIIASQRKGDKIFPVDIRVTELESGVSYSVGLEIR